MSIDNIEDFLTHNNQMKLKVKYVKMAFAMIKKKLLTSSK